MKKTTLIVFFLYIFFGVNSQENFPVVELYYQDTPESKFDSSENSTNISELGIKFSIPFAISERKTLLTELSYKTTEFLIEEKKGVNLQDVTGNGMYRSYYFDYTPLMLQEIALSAGLKTNYSEKMNFLFLLSPKISSDYLKSFDDLQFGGMVKVNFNKSENLQYKTGIYYNKEVYGHLFMPLIGFSFLSTSKKFELEMLLPMSIDIRYNLSKKVEFGLFGLSSLKSYNINDSFTLNDQEYSNLHVKKVAFESFSYLGFSISDFSIYFNVGYSLNRRYNIHEDNDKPYFDLFIFNLGDKHKVLNGKFEDGFIGNIGLKYYFK